MRPPRRAAAVHIPVLRAPVLTHLILKPGLTVVDATVGAGGHSSSILEAITPGGCLIGVDRDPIMLDIARRRLETSSAFQADRCHLFQGSYVTLPDILAAQSIDRVDRVLADLGLSSDQLADDDRGFSFSSGGPLDLRFDPTQGHPASELVRTLSRDEMASIFREFGEERHSERIARHIIDERKQSPVVTAQDLAAAVESVVPRRGRGAAHPATRVFQALRIAVNDELQHLTRFVGRILPDIVAPGGRVAIITFHSLEDRIVKTALRNADLWTPLTKKPVEPSAAEKRHNPRSRSAKLRVATRK